jgi:hypothetical protein
VDYIPFLTTAAAACQPTISGNAGVGGATLTYNGGSTVADSHGDYSIAVASGWSGTVTPSKANFNFAPTNKVYSGVASDLTGEDYTATLTAPMPVARVIPAHGSQVCPTPDVGVDLLLTNYLRKSGSFDPWTITLKLDGVEVTGSASSLQTMSSPASLAHVSYTPDTDLGTGLHQAELTYATASGPQTLQWNFTVAAIACPATGGTHGPESDETPPSSPDAPPSYWQDIDNP